VELGLKVNITFLLAIHHELQWLSTFQNDYNFCEGACFLAFVCVAVFLFLLKVYIQGVGELGRELTMKSMLQTFCNRCSCYVVYYVCTVECSCTRTFASSSLSN
jgi:hypothetical protein